MCRRFGFFSRKPRRFPPFASLVTSANRSIVTGLEAPAQCRSAAWERNRLTHCSGRSSPIKKRTSVHHLSRCLLHRSTDPNYNLHLSGTSTTLHHIRNRSFLPFLAALGCCRALVHITSMIRAGGGVRLQHNQTRTDYTLIQVNILFRYTCT